MGKKKEKTETRRKIPVDAMTCCISGSEMLDINSPAKIDVTCEYRWVDDVCIYSGDVCDFRHIVTETNMKNFLDLFEKQRS